MYHNVESDPMVGTLFDERYLIQSLVACGGMGNIYQAKDTRTGMIVALKMLRPEFSRDAIILNRFQLEASVVSRLKHKNICQMFDFGCVGGDRYYFTMEFLEGKPLDQILKNQRTLAPQTALQYIHQVAAALCDAHQHGVIHRDLKPANIFILQTANTEDFVKVLDFGVAKLEDEAHSVEHKLTNAGATLGTPFYMSPEQISGSDVDARADVYALGIILWECLFGVPPYRGNHLIEIFDATLHDKLPKLPAHLKKDPVWKRIYCVLEKALQKDKEKRYRSMAAFMRALEEVQPSGINTHDARMRTHESLPALGDGRSLLHFFQNLPMKWIWGAVILQFLIGVVATIIVFLMPAEVEVEKIQPYTSYTYKFYSDIPADVLINHKLQGKTPLTVDMAEPLPISIYVKAPEYPGQNIEITEHPEDIWGYAVNLNPKLVEDPHVYIETVPAGANVYINGELHDEITPCKVSTFTANRLDIKLTLDSYRSESIVAITNGGNLKLRTNLFRIRSKQ